MFARRKHRSRSSSEESIENILYYKDCGKNHNPSTTNSPPPLPLREPEPPPPRPDCKMSCTMCCGGECVNNDQSIPEPVSVLNQRTLGGLPNQMPRLPDRAIQPPLRPRKKKFKQPLLPPIGSRRDFGFTRENIKSLISQDEDIKKILKDLVKVTMQKVDLVEMINARRNEVEDAEDPVEDSENNEGA